MSNSNRFIHGDLLRQAQAAVNTTHQIWRKEQKIRPILFTWPGEPILAKGDRLHDAICVLDLPEAELERNTAVRAMVAQTRAYALLLIEQQQQQVRAILETTRGARSWSIPIVSHGNVMVLGEVEVQDDGPHVGLLWSPTRGEA